MGHEALPSQCIKTVEWIDWVAGRVWPKEVGPWAVPFVCGEGSSLFSAAWCHVLNLPSIEPFCHDLLLHLGPEKESVIYGLRPPKT